MTKNAWLLFVFLVYLAAILFFSFIYKRIYRRSPASFAFNGDISIVQRELKNNEAQINLPILRRQKEALEELRAIWSTIPELAWRQDSLTFDGPTFQFKIYKRAEKGIVGAMVFVHIDVMDREGHEIISLSPDYIRSKYRSVGQKIAEYEQLSNEPDSRVVRIWSYWDFLYFSVITQTTVGYGDILPNSTKVRMVVVSQILTGLVLLAIVVNLAVPNLASN